MYIRIWKYTLIVVSSCKVHKLCDGNVKSILWRLRDKGNCDPQRNNKMESNNIAAHLSFVLRWAAINKNVITTTAGKHLHNQRSNQQNKGKNRSIAADSDCASRNWWSVSSSVSQHNSNDENGNETTNCLHYITHCCCCYVFVVADLLYLQMAHENGGFVKAAMGANILAAAMWLDCDKLFN